MKKKSFNKGIHNLMKKGYSKQKAYNSMRGLAKKNKMNDNRVDLSKLPKPARLIILWGLGIYLVYALLPMMFELGIITGIGFFVTCALSLYKGRAVKNPKVIPIIAIGYILTNTATKTLLPQVYNSFVSESILVAVIMFVVFGLLYLRGREIINLGK